MKAVILAGGLGKRVRPYTLFLPKPMLPLGDKPIIGHVINWIKKQNINEIIISSSYMNETIENYYGNGKKYNVKIKYVKSKKPLGTAGQLKNAEKYLKGSFLCLYSDSIFYFNINNAIKFHKKNKSIVTMILTEYETQLKYGMIEINKDKSIKYWKEKPKINGLINTGCYIMNKDFFKYIPKNKVYDMDKSFKKCQKDKNKIFGYKVNGNILDLGDKESYEKSFREFSKVKKNAR